MQAIIMAAGKGTRLGDLTKNVPKPLIPINGIPILKRQIDTLLKIPEISEILVITGYLANHIRKYIEDNYKQNKIRLIHNEEYDKGAIVTLSKAEPYIKEGFLVINADHLFSSKAYKHVIEKTQKIIVCFFTNRTPYEDERKVKVYEDGRIELSKKHKDYDYGYNGLVAVGSKYKEDYFKCVNDAIVANNYDFHPDDMILPLSEKGIPIQLCDLSKYTFIEIDNLEDYKQAEEKIYLIESEDEEEEIAKILTFNYELKINKVEAPHLGGYINRNYIINTDQGKFFFQQIDEKRNIKSEIEILSFLTKRDFPVPQIIQTKLGLPYSNFNNKKGILTEFIEGHSPIKFNDLSNNQIIQAVKTLALLHKHLNDYSGEKIFNPNTAPLPLEEAIKICQDVIQIISKKEELDQFDNHVKSIIQKKLKLLKEYDEDALQKKLSKCPKIFCHGDYHGANLIFNDNDKIVGVIDWEYFGYDYRIWEIARSMSFICDIDYTGSMLGPISFSRAKKYLKSYHELLPLTKDEIDIMVDLLQFKSLCSCFVLEKHYIENIRSCDVFLPKKTENWFWWLENGETFKEEVLNDIK